MLADRDCRIAINRVYASFVAQLPEDQREPARQLPSRLGLTWETDIEWGEVFDDVAYLGLPMLLLNEDPYAEDGGVRFAALRAHVFAMIAALIHERLERGDIEPDAALCGILLVLERERESIVSELFRLGDGDSRPDCYAAEREARGAIAKEKAIFDSAEPALMKDYLTICVSKQSPAFPVAMAAAVAGGFDTDALGHVHDLVLGVTLGIAARDEVKQWLDRAQFGRSWAVALANESQTQSDVVMKLLEFAAMAFAKASKAAVALGGHRLAHWTSGQEYAARALANAEQLNPGYALFGDRPRTTLPDAIGLGRAA